MAKKRRVTKAVLERALRCAVEGFFENQCQSIDPARCADCARKVKRYDTLVPGIAKKMIDCTVELCIHEALEEMACQS